MSSRKPDLVVGQRLQPIHLLEIQLLVPLILSEHRKEVRSFCSSQDFGLFREIWHKRENKGRDEDGDETLDDEYPSKAFQSSNTMHIADAVC